ncbi:MAG: hypothetical protein PHV18_08870 [Lachnospiraceae bacterium]|nr:hypothetical protein [Lachnospiraceae bacterium]
METREVMIEKVKNMMAAPSCYAGLKTAGQSWMDAVGTADEKAAAKKLIDEIEADVLKVEDVLAFMQTDVAKAKFGAETAEKFAKHMAEIKAAGATYCDCPACTAGVDILNHKDSIL